MLIAENGNSPLCVYRLQHPITSYTGLMRLNFVNNQTMKNIGTELFGLADSVTGHFGQTIKSWRNLTLMQSRAV